MNATSIPSAEYGVAVADEFTSTYHLTGSVLGPDRFAPLCDTSQSLHPVPRHLVVGMTVCPDCANVGAQAWIRSHPYPTGSAAS